MPPSIVIALICATVISYSVNATAEEGVQSEPAASKVKVFLIAPEESNKDFMCESGRVESVLATAIAEHRVVSIVYLDQSRKEIPAEGWSAAYGFRLLHRQNIKVQATMICGN